MRVVQILAVDVPVFHPADTHDGVPDWSTIGDRHFLIPLTARVSGAWGDQVAIEFAGVEEECSARRGTRHPEQIRITTSWGIGHLEIEGEVTIDIADTYGTMVHEYQHLINYSAGGSDTWINECMGAASGAA